VAVEKRSLNVHVENRIFQARKMAVLLKRLRERNRLPVKNVRQRRKGVDRTGADMRQQMDLPLRVFWLDERDPEA